MKPPEKIRVAYEDTIFGHQGRLSDGRAFIAFTTGAAANGRNLVDRILAVLHLFDADGNHLETKSRVCGYCQNKDTYREDRDRASKASWPTLDELLAELAPFRPEYVPVDVRPFEQIIDGVEHGFYFRPIVDDQSDDEWVIHMPRNHWYFPPWNTGEYNT